MVTAIIYQKVIIRSILLLIAIGGISLWRMKLAGAKAMRKPRSESEAAIFLRGVVRRRL